MITIIILLPWHTVLEQGKATNKGMRWWSVTLNKKLETYRVVNSLDCEAARKNILINEVSFGKHMYGPTLLGGAAPKPRKPTRELHEFVLSYVPLPSVRDGLPSTQEKAMTTGFGSPCCTFHGSLKWKMPWDSPYASLVPLHRLGPDFPRSCHPWGDAGTMVPQAPQLKALVPETMGWSLHCKDQVLKWNAICIHLKAQLFNLSLLCSYFYC